MTRTELVAHLRTLNACDEALEWINQTLGSPEDLWAACQRGDWMVWLLTAVNYDARILHHIACDIAEGVLPIYERAHPDDPRPRDAIAVARRYADGTATYGELRAARGAVWDAARDAAQAAAWAADAIWAAADDALLAASSGATRAALWAASAAPGDAARAAVMSRLADIVRARVSWTDVERALERFEAAKMK